MLVEIPEVIQTGFKVPHKVLIVERGVRSNKIKKALVGLKVPAMQSSKY